MRHEKMKEILGNIGAEIVHYEDGLTLDIECLNKIADIVMTHYSEFACCDVCKEVKAYDDMTRSGIVIENTWRPICKACAKKHAKLFFCAWGDGYELGKDGRAITAEHNLDFFSLENGYSGSDMIAIDNLDVGASYSANDCGWHTIIRIR